jgi:cyclic pyranopterin phosphate synthase
MGKKGVRSPSRMIDIGEKGLTHRVAVAVGEVHLKQQTLERIMDRRVFKGDVLEVARIAGISAAKQTSSLIPLCHPISITNLEIDYEIKQGMIQIKARAEAIDRTGVEMEAMTAVSVCGLTIYDMCKSIDPYITLTRIRLVEKMGGRSGHFVRK